MLKSAATIALSFAASVAGAIALSHTEPQSAIDRLRERIYGHPIMVQGQLGDRHETYRDLSARIGQPFTTVAGRLPLDSSFSDALLWLSSLERDSDARANAARELMLPTFLADLELRSRELASARLTAMQKAFEQRMYWDVYESLAVLQSQQDPQAAQIAHRLAALIHALRLTRAEIDTLAYDERGLISRIFSDHGRSLAAPLVIDVFNRRATSMHAIVAGGRSCFEGRAIIGNASADEAEILHRWHQKRELEQRVLNQEVEQKALLTSSLPDYPPSGTVFVLFRYMIVIDEDNTPRRLPIVESAAVRFFAASGQSNRRETYALYELDPLASIEANQRKYAAVGTDEIVWSGLLSGRPDRMTAQGLALVTTMGNNCASCHNFAAPGAGQLLAFMVGVPIVPIESATKQCDLALRYLKQTESYIDLQAQLQGLEERSP